MPRISAIFLFLFFGSLFISGQTVSPEQWKTEVLRLNHGEILKGLTMEENTKYLVFKSITHKPNSPFRISTVTVERKDIDFLTKISAKDRTVLESNIKTYAEKMKENPNFPNANLRNPNNQPPVDQFKQMDLIPLVGNTEPPRLRQGLYSYFSIAPNSNRVYLGDRNEKDYLRLRKSTLIQGNDSTGRIKDAVFYQGKLHTGMDSGNIAIWDNKSLLEKSYKALDASIRLMVPMNLDMLVFDQKWQFHRCDPKTENKISFEKPTQLPLKTIGYTSKFLGSKHGTNHLTVWNLNDGTLLYSLKNDADFEYLISPEENYLAIIKADRLDILEPNTGKILFKSIPKDPGTFCAFASAEIMDANKQFNRGYVLIIQDASQLFYLDLKNNKKIKNPTLPKLYKGEIVEAEVEIVRELSVYPGTNLDGQGSSNPLKGSGIGSTQRNAYVVGDTGRVKKVSRHRPLIPYLNIHSTSFQPDTRLDLESKYLLDSQLHCEIVPASTTLCLDEKIAYCSGDKYFHLVGGFRNNFKVERGTYFNLGNVCLNTSGTKMAHTAYGSTFYVWDTEKKSKSATLGGDSPTTCMAISGDGKSMVSCHKSGSIMNWNLEGDAKLTKKAETNSLPQKVLLSEDGSKTLVHSKNGVAYFFNSAAPPEVIPDLKIESELSVTNKGANGFFAFKAFQWKPIWDPQITDNDAEVLKSNPHFHPDNLKSKDNLGVNDNQDQLISMNKSATKAISLLDQLTLGVWNLLENKLDFKVEHEQPISSCKISDDGRYIITGNQNMEVFVFSGSNGQKLYRFQDDYGPIYSLGFFQKEKYACLGSRYGVTFWDLEKGKKSYTLLTIGGILFFDENGYFDSDHHSKNYFAFRDMNTMSFFKAMQNYGNSGGTLSPYEKILKSKERPGLLKAFLGAENLDAITQ